MLICSDKQGHISLVLWRSKRETGFIGTHNKKRKLLCISNISFDRDHKLTDNCPVETAKRWLISPIHMTNEVRRRLEMIVALKGNTIVAKYDETPATDTVGKGISLIGGTDDLMALSLKKITNLYNKISGNETPVTFETLTEASAACWSAMENFTVPEKEVKEKTPRVKKDPSERQARAIKGAITKSSIITLLVTENPKKEGSKGAQAFSHYRSGMTVAEFCEAAKGVGGLADIRWDAAHNYISLEHVDDPTPEPKVKKEETPTEG